MNDLERAKVISENKALSKDQRSVGVMAALMGINNDSVIKSMVTVGNAELTKKATAKAKKPRRPRGMDKTQAVLYDMLTENTGVAMMDSGGDNGRHWQKNVGRDFRDEPEYTYYVTKDFAENPYVNITKSLFHHLDNNCVYNDEETKKFKKWCKRSNAETYHYGSAEQYLEEMYGAEGNVNYYTGLSYENGDSILSQGFQYTTYQGMIFLQIHGGADIRGGYTDIKVFNCEDELVGYSSDCGLSCGCGHLYSDDAGYHWYDSFEAVATDNYDSGLPKCWVIDEESSLDYEKYLKCKECGEVVEA